MLNIHTTSNSDTRFTSNMNIKKYVAFCFMHVINISVHNNASVIKKTILNSTINNMGYMNCTGGVHIINTSICTKT